MSATNRIPDHVHAVSDPDGAVLLDVKRGKYFSLNGVGSEIWEGLRAGASPSEIAAGLERGYGVSPERARADVSAFVARLEREALVHGGR